MPKKNIGREHIRTIKAIKSTVYNENKQLKGKREKPDLAAGAMIQEQ